MGQEPRALVWTVTALEDLVGVLETLGVTRVPRWQYENRSTTRLEGFQDQRSQSAWPPAHQWTDLAERSSADILGFMAASSKVLSEALKLPVQERVRIAEKLLESADADGFQDDTDAGIHAAWADEITQRSQELRDDSVRGLSVAEARRIVQSDPADNDR